jgi:hypothetical protein
VKAAFRLAYSLFDKIAYFLNDYLNLNIQERNITFKTLWYESQKRKNQLRDEFQSSQNWPLRGLFWLSKDLYEDREGFTDYIEPDARDLCVIRNHLEHKYLKLHDEFWSPPLASDDSVDLSLRDTLAYSVHRGEFEFKALRLMKIARAGMIYLSLAVHMEEHERRKQLGGKVKLVQMHLDSWEDDWKV